MLITVQNHDGISCGRLEFTNSTIPVQNGKFSASSRFQAQGWNVIRTALNMYFTDQLYICT